MVKNSLELRFSVNDRNDSDPFEIDYNANNLLYKYTEKKEKKKTIKSKIEKRKKEEEEGKEEREEKETILLLNCLNQITNLTIYK